MYSDYPEARTTPFDKSSIGAHTFAEAVRELDRGVDELSLPALQGLPISMYNLCMNGKDCLGF